MQAIHYPATAGTMLLALIATIAAWCKVDVAPLLVDAHVAHGQLWRLLTGALVHADAIHLTLNLIFLWTFGTIVEEHFGPGRTFALFGFLALGSGAAEFALLDGGIGLSGVGYGLVGMLMVLENRDPLRFENSVGPRVASVLFGFFFVCVGLTISGIYPIANVAHAAAAGLGALLALAMTFMHVHRTHAYAGVGIVAVALLVFATLARPIVNVSPRRGTEEAFLGYQALLKNDDRAAAWWFRDATVARPENADYWFNRGVAEARLEHAARALRAYERAAELSPANANYRNALTEMKTYVRNNASP